MGVSVGNLVEVEVGGREADVGLGVDPDGERVPVSDEDPLADVELATLHDQRILDILLANVQLPVLLVADQLIAVFELYQV